MRRLQRIADLRIRLVVTRNAVLIGEMAIQLIDITNFGSPVVDPTPSVYPIEMDAGSVATVQPLSKCTLVHMLAAQAATGTRKRHGVQFRRRR
jgi:hypothetical protein